VDYTYLGRTGAKVSRLCLGTMNFGPHTPEDESHTIMDAALDLGINFFDTANAYGRSEELGTPKGRTEEIIGNWFAKGGGRRDRVVLATKVFGEMPGGTHPLANEGGLSALHIRKACDESLRRLQTDHIDLYQMHHVQRDTPWDEIWQAMEQLVTAGKVLYVGSSNFAGWHVAQANEAARQRHFLGLVAEQCVYNLTQRMVEVELLPACQGYGLGVIPWSPLAGGVLGGVLKQSSDGRRSAERGRERIERFRPQIERYEAFCDEIGQDPAVVALAWLLHQPAVTAPIIGPRTLDQLTGAPIRALELRLDAEQLAAIDEIWPGYTTGPEQWAW